MSQWKKVRIDFKTIKLGNYIEPIKTTVAELNMKNPVVYGVTNKEGIVQTGKPASKDISNYIVLEENCFAFNPYRINVGSIGINDKNLTGCVSPAYVVFKTKNGLLPKFLFFYLKSDYGIHLINWYGNRGGVRNALRYSDLCNIDIPDIRNINQELLLQKFSSVSENINQITQELETQKQYVKQLRQNILQDAIEGKLTANWRETHPVIKGNPDYDAEALFEQIQKEKNSEKKQKDLSPVTDEEKPFEIPEGWKWVRLGEIIDSIVYGTSEKCSYDDRQNSAILRIPNISSGYIDISDLKYTNLSETEKKELSLMENDLLVIRSNGSPEIVGKMVCVPKDFENYCYAGYLIRIRFIIPSIGFYIGNISNAKLLRNQIEEPLRSTVGINNINSDEIKFLMVPLPPLAEQTEIVQVIGEDLKKIDKLVSQIKERELYTIRLMQSILKDAFKEIKQGVKR